MKKNFLLLDKISQLGLEIFEEFSSIDDGCQFEHEQILNKIDKYDGVIIKSGNRINKQIIDKGTKLKFIARAGSGIDNIDVDYLERRDIKLFTSAEGNARSVSEYVLGTIIMSSHKLFEAHQAAKSNNFQRFNWKGRNIKQLKIGVFGYGIIGQDVVKVLSPLCKNVYVYNKKYNNEHNQSNIIFSTSVEDIISDLDVITIHTSLNEETEFMFNDRIFKLMKKGVLLINTARGKIINDNALLRAIKDGTISYAVLDSLYPDPHYNTDPLLNNYCHFLINHPKIFYTPHIAAGTQDALDQVAIDLANKIKKYIYETENNKY